MLTSPAAIGILLSLFPQQLNAVKERGEDQVL